MSRRGDDEPRALSDSLDALLRSLRGPGRQSLGGVFGRWDEVVGAAVAAHVRPVRLDRGVLTVEVTEPAWATQVAFMADELRDRLASEVGVTVDRIEARVARPGRHA